MTLRLKYATGLLNHRPVDFECGWICQMPKMLRLCLLSLRAISVKDMDLARGVTYLPI